MDIATIIFSARQYICDYNRDWANTIQSTLTLILYRVIHSVYIWTEFSSRVYING